MLGFNSVGKLGEMPVKTGPIGFELASKISQTCNPVDWANVSNAGLNAVHPVSEANVKAGSGLGSVNASIESLSLKHP